MVSIADKRRPGFDPTHYPVSDDMGEGTLQRFISELLRPVLAWMLEQRGETAFVGADTFFYWVQFDSSKAVAPDIYVLPGVSKSPRVGSWKLWELNAPPKFALEVVSMEVYKDYEINPARYAQVGVDELIVFDPDFELSPARNRFRVHRRVPRKGFLLVEQTNADRVRSRALRCWLRAVGEGEELRLRAATGLRGEHVVPTAEERAALAEVTIAENAKASGERARAAEERARVAEEEAGRLRKVLASRRRRG